MKVGKTYSLHFGKDIYVKYRVISFENEHEDGLLERIEDIYIWAQMKKYYYQNPKFIKNE